MKKFQAIAVAASMFALATCGEKEAAPAAQRYLLRMKGWDNRYYTVAIFESREAAERDLDNRVKHGFIVTDYIIEPEVD